MPYAHGNVVRFALPGGPAKHLRPPVERVDLADVDVLRVPPCHALRQQLVIGSDGCSVKLKVYLKRRAERSGLLGSARTPGLASYFGDKNRLCMYSAAIVGGCDLRQRFVVYARAGKARARRLGLAPRPRGSRRARPRSCQSSKLTHAVLSQQWRGERVEQT